ncbi:MAG: DUF424 domain-containing protein [Nanoarchaeota archaeon]
MSIIAKRHTSPAGELIIAACDESCLGSTFEEGSMQLDCSRQFFGGEEIDASTLSKLLKKAKTANLIGEETVAAAKQANMIDDVKMIDSVPYAHLYRIDE